MPRLNRLTERIWFYPFEQERDRPNLIYIRGEKWSLAVDAGHSAEHTAEFYRALEGAGLPLPALTVLTHWHWDHAFGMHAVRGLTLANERTNHHLLAFREKIAREGNEAFFSIDERIRREYADGRPVVIVPADLTFIGEMGLDLGRCPVRIFQADAPHTDDSTLIYAEDERALFVGDAGCGALPDWKKAPALTRRLAEKARALDAETVLEGHWTPVTKEEWLEDLMNGD